eukprot:g47376.t1
MASAFDEQLLYQESECQVGNFQPTNQNVILMHAALGKQHSHVSLDFLLKNGLGYVGQQYQKEHHAGPHACGNIDLEGFEGPHLEFQTFRDRLSRPHSLEKSPAGHQLLPHQFSGRYNKRRRIYELVHGDEDGKNYGKRHSNAHIYEPSDRVK